MAFVYFPFPLICTAFRKNLDVTATGIRLKLTWHWLIKGRIYAKNSLAAVVSNLWCISRDVSFHILFKNLDLTSDLYRGHYTVWWHECCAYCDGPLNRDRLNTGEEWRQVQSHSLQAFSAHNTHPAHRRRRSGCHDNSCHGWKTLFFGKWKVIFLPLTPLPHLFLSIIRNKKHCYFFLHYLDSCIFF